MIVGIDDRITMLMFLGLQIPKMTIHELVSGASCAHELQEWNLSMVPQVTIVIANGTNIMVPLAPLHGNTQFTIIIQSEWIIW